MTLLGWKYAHISEGLDRHEETGQAVLVTKTFLTELSVQKSPNIFHGPFQNWNFWLLLSTITVSKRVTYLKNPFCCDLPCLPTDRSALWKLQTPVLRQTKHNNT